MSILDRNLQLEILENLKGLYPESYNFRDKLSQLGEEDLFRYTANLHYLQDHGLIQNALSERESLNGPTTLYLCDGKITAKGLDFLEDDGGLSAILETRIIKIHEDSIKDIFTKAIHSSNIPSEQKSVLIDKIKTMPLDVCTNLITKVFEKLVCSDALSRLISNFPNLPF